ncbi:adenylate/guanylate cyclase domain-containing protein [Halarchaeum nitratireducens]|uniref:adenylate/guanylate cyclase domain-containing protein n=1 Tax=Halarchaeum nitratireducens TaxID=489913 RepID=UPI00166E9836|nr:hypothetical protein [Halarchaeum nitratireducens]
MNERLKDVATGKSHPRNWNKRLNEPKSYHIATVFIDIDHFTEYLLNNGKRATLYMLGLFIPEAMRVINEYDGYFEKNTGDGLLAYFGFGKSAQESVSDVLQYITTIRWVLSHEVNPRLEELNVQPVTVSSGAAYGEAYLAEIGTPSRDASLKRLTAVSPQVNTAFQLETQAGDDEHLVGPAIEYHADEDDQEYLLLEDIYDQYQWANPETEEMEPYAIYRYGGEWMEDTVPLEEEVEG